MGMVRKGEGVQKCVTSFMDGPQGEVSIPLGQAIAGAGAATIIKYKKYKQLLKLLKLLAPSIGEIGGGGGGKGQNTQMTSTASLSHLRTMLPKSSSCPQPAQRPNHAT